VRRLFTAALHAREIPIRRGPSHSRPFTDDEVRAIVAAYCTEGVALILLSRTWHCGTAKIVDALHGAGVPVRPAGRPADPLTPTRRELRKALVARRRHADNPQRDPKVKTVDVRELIEAGAVALGHVELHDGASVYNGTLLENGRVRLDDGSEHTLGGAVHKLTGTWDSGYMRWQSGADGRLLSLDALRARYLARRAAERATAA
jgi:hypothetical protein